LIEPRLYRAAFLPALLAVVVAAFSLENRPRPVPQGLAADVLFDGTSASSTVNAILQDASDRRLGTPGDARTAARIASAFHRYGFTVTTDRFGDEGQQLVNVVGRRPGLSREEIVLVASRDAASVPDATGSAADSAALIEVARTLSGRAANKTIVLASVDGGTRGEVGATRLAGQLGDTSLVSGVVVLSNTGAARSRGPLLVDWSNDPTRGSLGLRRTAADSLRNELGIDGGPEATPAAQLARLALPVAPGAQGVLIPQGLPAIRLSGSGELAPPPGRRRSRDLNTDRYGAIGRATLRIVSALDASPSRPAHGPSSYVTVAGSVLPGWALALVAAALILPALMASIDGLARASRRRQPVTRWLVWLGAGVLPFAAGLGLAELLVMVGLAKDAPPAPLDPGAAPLDGRATANLGAVALVVVLAWLLMRTSVLRRGRPRPSASAPGAGCAVAVALSLVAVVAWFLNPFLALALVLPLHCWMLATMADIRPSARAWLALIGVLPAFAIAAIYMHELSLGPVDFAWYLFLLGTGGQAGLGSTLVGCAVLGIFGSVVAIVVAHMRSGTPKPERVGPPPPPAAVGPATRLERAGPRPGRSGWSVGGRAS
jgi:hypothetical protein